MALAVRRGDSVTDRLRQQAIAFHRENPLVWRLFERFALEAARSGHTVGAKAIWERLRWETRVNPDYRRKGDFKLNNSHTAYYARAFLRRYPEHAGLFETRERKAG